MPATPTELSRRPACFRALSALVMLLLVAGCSKSAAPTAENAEPAPKTRPEVRVVEVQLHPWPKSVRVQGTLMPHEQSVVSTRVAGEIERVPVDLGSIVKAGDELVKLDDKEFALGVNQSEAQLAQACASIGITPDKSEKDLDRTKAPPVMLERAALDEATAAVARARQLVERKAITTDEFQRTEALEKAAQARYDSALNSVGAQIALIGVRRAELALAKKQLTDTSIVAPYQGVVELRHVSPGEHVEPGDPIVTIVRADTLRFRAGVPERAAEQIRPGQPVQIHLAGEDKPIDASVSRVSPALVQSSRSLWIEADVPNNDRNRRTGLFAEADIIVDRNTQSMTVPTGSITEFAGIEKVWVVRNGEAAEQPIRTGRRDGERVEVLQGLSIGDLVVARSSEGQSGAVTVVRDSSESGPRTATSNGQEESNASE
ncbi:MAG: efflux RND transporter periplasmic adaptor subunit [Planctomycetaceae bacterium]